jgi:hypothetical protein
LELIQRQRLDPGDRLLALGQDFRVKPFGDQRLALGLAHLCQLGIDLLLRGLADARQLGSAQRKRIVVVRLVDRNLGRDFVLGQFCLVERVFRTRCRFGRPIGGGGSARLCEPGAHRAASLFGQFTFVHNYPLSHCASS